jgi:hypothetical protein
MSGRLRRIVSAFVLFGGPRRCGERTERGKLLRCSGPKKQNDGRPLLFGCVDAPLVALTWASTQQPVSTLNVAILR